MPIYEYQCRKCGTFEVTQRITEDPLKRCPTCRSSVSKLISQTSFQLKGTGWYVTDYADKGKPDSTKAEPSAKKASAPSSSSSDSSDSAEKPSKKKSSSEKSSASAA